MTQIRSSNIMNCKKIVKVTGYILLGVVVLLCIGVIVGSDYMVKFSLSPRENRENVESVKAYFQEKNPDLVGWVEENINKGILTDTFVTMPSGERHHGYFLKNENAHGRTAVVVHGYKSCAYHMLNFAKMFYDQFDCNVVLPDLHAHFLSEGEMIQMGWKDADDVLQWIEVAHDRFSEEGVESKLLVMGISMGAATIMNISGKENLPPYIKGFIEDCGYTSVWDEFAHVGKRDFGLPKFPLLHIASKMCDRRYGWNFQEASPLESVKRSTLPMLFIHGDSDDFVPSWMVHPLYEAKQGEKYLWIAPGSAHAKAYTDHPEEYIEQVVAFAQKINF